MARRLGILAGGGELVAEVIDAARASGDEVAVVTLAGQGAPAGVVHLSADLAMPETLLAALRGFGATHATLVGKVDLPVSARRGLLDMAGGGSSLADVDMSNAVAAMFARLGIALLGAHDVAPGLVAEVGLIAGPQPEAQTLIAARRALRLAREIGRLDLGQAAVASPSRAIAAEDAGGTDALIARVGHLISGGALAPGGEVLVLGKARKPQQPDYVDLPVIGAATIRGAHAAGLSAIAVEAGWTLLARRDAISDAARELGVPVIGMAVDE